MSTRLPLWIHAAVAAAVVLAAYAADAGGAFIKEDANWIMRSRIRDAGDVTRLITDTGGFFRPVVGLSFAINHWMFGGRPAGYGWTNLLLVFGIAAALFRLARLLDFPRGAAILASALWALNVHGINMTVLWLSGRTALLLTCFSVLAAIAAAQGRVVLMAVCTLLAMASKEEGVLLPVILGALVWLRPQGVPGRGGTVRAFAVLVLVWLVYAAVRTLSDAYTPTRAPAFYTFDFSLRHVLDNAIEYADRALTFTAAVTLTVVAVVRTRASLSRADWGVITFGGIWVVAGFALTTLLPTRSSLYAVFPSVGGALASALIVNRLWDASSERRQRVLAALAVILPVAMLPVYWQRNERWTELASVSRSTVAAFAQLAPGAPARWRVLIVDDRSTRANVAAALAWGLTDTVELVTGRRPHVWIVPPPPDIDPREIVTSPATVDDILELRGGRVVKAPTDSLHPTRAGEYF